MTCLLTHHCYYNFFQPFATLPSIFVTARHKVLSRPQDAVSVWVEELRENDFKVCLREAKIFDGPHENIDIVRNWILLSTSYTNTKLCPATPHYKLLPRKPGSSSRLASNATWSNQWNKMEWVISKLTLPFPISPSAGLDGVYRCDGKEFFLDWQSPV